MASMESTPKLKVALFLGSMRPNRFADRVGTYLVDAIRSKGMEPIVVDPAKYPLEVLQLPIVFMQNYEEEAPQWMKEVHEIIKSADAFLIAAPEYNAMIGPALTNLMDHFPPSSYRNRPCGLVSYSLGCLGGVRARTLLRIYVAEFGMYPVPTSVLIPNVDKCITEEGIVSNERVVRNIGNQLNELAWLATAIKNHKAVSPIPSNEKDIFY